MPGLNIMFLPEIRLKYKVLTIPQVQKYKVLT